MGEYESEVPAPYRNARIVKAPLFSARFEITK